MQNWAELTLAALAFIKVVVRITPGLQDDAVFEYVDRLIEVLIPENE